jgi:hypothetical protein
MSDEMIETYPERTSTQDQRRSAGAARRALTGTKKRCDRGECGAGSVHVEGRRILSCMALAAMQDGKRVTTNLARRARLAASVHRERGRGQLLQIAVSPCFGETPADLLA